MTSMHLVECLYLILLACLEQSAQPFLLPRPSAYTIYLIHP